MIGKALLLCAWPWLRPGQGLHMVNLILLRLALIVGCGACSVPGFSADDRSDWVVGATMAVAPSAELIAAYDASIYAHATAMSASAAWHNLVHRASVSARDKAVMIAMAPLIFGQRGVRIELLTAGSATAARFSFELGKQAQEWVSAIAAASGWVELAKPVGLLSAWQTPQSVVTVSTTRMNIGINIEPSNPGVRSQTHHFSMGLRGAAWRDVMLAPWIARGDLTADEAASLWKLFAPEQLYLSAQINAGGISDVADWKWPALSAVTKPIEADCLAMLPSKPLLVTAFAINGSDVWTKYVLPMLDQMVISAARSGRVINTAELQNTWVAPLRTLVPEVTLAEVITGLNGSWGVALSPGSPLPIATVIVPRSTFSDRMITQLLKMGEAAMPGDDETALVPIPDTIISLAIRKRQKYWYVSNDLTAVPGSERPAMLSKLPAAARMVTVIDVPALVTAANSFAAVMPTMTADKRYEFQQFTAPGLHMAPVTFVLASDGNRLRSTSSGPLSQTALPLAAAVLVPMVAATRTKAMQATSRNQLITLGRALLVYRTSHDDRLPSSWTELLRDPTVLPELLISPGGKERGVPEPHYVLIRQRTPQAELPLAMENPACWDGHGAQVLCGDGSTRFIAAPAAPALWSTLAAGGPDRIWPAEALALAMKQAQALMESAAPAPAQR